MASVIVLVSIVAGSYLCQYATSYSYDFQVQINYSGVWKLTYWAWHNSLNSCSAGGSAISGYYVKKTITGNGSDSFHVTLSGSENEGPVLSLVAQKLNASNATLSFAVNNVGYNNTSLPRGSANSCSSVTP